MRARSVSVPLSASLLALVVGLGCSEEPDSTVRAAPPEDRLERPEVDPDLVVIERRLDEARGRAGELAPEAGGELRQKLDEVERALEEAKNDAASTGRQQIQEIERTLDEVERKLAEGR